MVACSLLWLPRSRAVVHSRAVVCGGWQPAAGVGWSAAGSRPRGEQVEDRWWSNRQGCVPVAAGGTSGRDGASAPAGRQDSGALTGRGKKQHPRHPAQHRGDCYQDFQAEQVFHPLSSTQTRPFL